MNYIEMINQYWQLREQGILTGAEGDLYMYLLHMSNKLGWKNPFNQSNALICAILTISEPTLIRHRNTLKQVSLINFESGKSIKKNTQYYLNNLSSSVSSGVSRPVSSSVSSGVSRPVRQRKTKPNKTTTPPIVPPTGGSEGSPPNEKFLNFKKWISENAPRVEQLKQPFTENEYTKIFEKWKRDEVLTVLAEMHNYKPLTKKNISAYLTADNWLKRRKNDEKTNEQPKKPYVTD
ncbi:MAG: hypothetical protein LBL90_03670 [Prevotellaceae bacterium]|jgi:hypothetical protein|nr:hypothetical protein [Prevotellaceae bacterium]